MFFLGQEINLWTYWQGRGYEKYTPYIKYMLIGQDFGPPEKEEAKGTIANVREMNKGNDVMFHEHVDLSAKDSQTDFNLIKYFSLIGKPDIHKNRYSDLFVTVHSVPVTGKNPCKIRCRTTFYLMSHELN